MGRYLDLLKNVQGIRQPEPAVKYRSLTPAQLATLDITLRIAAPSAADSWSIEDWLEWISERAAILEFDGGFDRALADNRVIVLLEAVFRRRQHSVAPDANSGELSQNVQ